MGDSVQRLLIRQALIDNFNQYAEGLDSKNWPLVRDCFADRVYVDYGSLSAATGHADVSRDADDWIALVRQALARFDRTHHRITNHRLVLEGGEVACRAYLAADHVRFADPAVQVARPDDVVTLVGEYSNVYLQEGEHWKIHRSRLHVHWTAGNLEL